MKENRTDIHKKTTTWYYCYIYYSSDYLRKSFHMCGEGMGCASSKSAVS